MSEPSFTEILKSLEKGEIKPIYYLVGQEAYFHDQFIRTLTVRLFPDKASQDLNLTVLYGTENTLQDLMGAIFSYPMMADRRLVVVRSFNKMSISDPEALSKYLNNPQKTTCLVLSASEEGRTKIFKEIRQKAVVVPCKPLREYQVADWLIALAKSKDLQLTPEAAQMMVDHLGPHLLVLEQELAKLADYKTGQNEITLQDVEEVTGTSGADIFALQKALAARNLENSLKIGQRLLESGVDFINVNAVLFAYFRKATIAASLKRRGKTSNDIGNELKVKPFQLKQILAATANFNYIQLKTIIKMLAELDVQSKTTSFSGGAALQMLCYKICRL